MPLYLKPWRRKLGVLTLLMACALTAGWVRSFFICDKIVHGEGVIEIGLYSLHGLVTLELGDNGSHTGEMQIPRWKSQNAAEMKHLLLADEIEWLLNGFGFGVSALHEGPLLGLCVAPYWSIAIPLTLLSAWLLLTKPRVAEAPEVLN